jgi:signal transduction histidine kinase
MWRLRERLMGWPSRIFSGLRSRILALVILVLIPAFGVVWFSYARLRERERREAEATVRQLARVIASDYREIVDESSRYLTLLAEVPAVRAGSEYCQPILARLVARHALFANIATATPDGVLTCNTAGSPAGTRIGDRAYFRRALRAHGGLVGEFVVGRLTGRPIIVMALPVIDGGNVVLVVTATIDLQRLSAAAQHAPLVPDAAAVLIDGRGVVLTRYPDPARWIGKQVGQTPLFTAVGSRPEGTAEVNGLDGVRRIIGWTTLGRGVLDVPVHAVVGVPASFVYAAIVQIAAVGAMALMLVALVTVVAGLEIGHRFVIDPIDRLVEATSRLAGGDLRAQTDLPQEMGELSRLAQTFNTMASAVAERETQLRDQARRLQSLSRRLVETQEAERRHIARELHDEIGQILTALKLTLQMAARDPAVGLRKAQEMADVLLEQVRSLALRLRPSMLDDLGLLATLTWHFQRYGEQSGIQVAFTQTGLDRRFPSEVETVAYRVIQEALTNVARHAGAGEVVVWVEGTPDYLAFEIEDRGTGFDRDALDEMHSSGLSGIRERVGLVGGTVSIESTPGKGTRLAVCLPVSQAENRP